MSEAVSRPPQSLAERRLQIAQSIIETLKKEIVVKDGLLKDSALKIRPSDSSIDLTDSLLKDKEFKQAKEFIGELAADKAGLEMKISELEERNETLRAAREKFDEKEAELQTCIRTQTEQIELLRKNLEASQSKNNDLSLKLKESGLKVKQFGDQLNDLESQLINKLDEFNESRLLNANIASDLSLLQTTHTTTLAQLNFNEKDLKSRIARGDHLENHLDRSRTRILLLETELSERDDIVVQMDKEIELKEADIRGLSMKISTLCQKQGDGHYVIERMSQEKSMLLKRVADLERLREQDRESREELVGAMEDLKHTNDHDLRRYELLTKNVLEKCNIREDLHKLFALNWRPNNSTIACSNPLCDQQFSLVVRRHHCRMCGFIFCNNHSQNYVKLSLFTREVWDHGVEARVCDLCCSSVKNGFAGPCA